MVERGVAGLDDEAVACLRRDRGDEFRAEAFFGRLPDEPRCVAVPDASVVVRIDDRNPGARVFDSGHERRVARTEGFEELLTVFVTEIVDDVDEEECVLQSSVGSRTVARANE